MEAIDEWTKRLEQLSDEALMRRTEGLVARCNRLTAALVLHLAEVDRCGGHLRLGFGSLFAYCTERLGLSEAAAYQRIRAARVVRRRPRVATMLARGELHLSGLTLLAAKLDEAEGEQLLEAARGKSKREIERMLADRDPLPIVPDRIRRLAPPARRGSEQDALAGNRQTALPTAGPLVPGTPGGPLAPGTAGGHLVPESPGEHLVPGPPGEHLVPETPGPVQSAPPFETRTAATGLSLSAPPTEAQIPVVAPRHVGARTAVEIRPLGGERYRVQLTGGAELVRALEKCRALSAHNLHGELGAVIEAALTQYAAHLEKKRFGIGAKPRGGRKRAAGQGGARAKRKGVTIRATEGAPTPLARDQVGGNGSAGHGELREQAGGNGSTDRGELREQAGRNGSTGRGELRAQAGRNGSTDRGELREQAGRNGSGGSIDAGSAKRDGGQRSRYVATEVRRRVAERDGLRCSFRAEDGRRCEQRAYLELDHWRPFALGGANDVANLRLLCRAHNQARNVGLTDSSAAGDRPT
ncbi:MAG: DUF222 domain-containing protein [Myxococcales bacterium]|nr:DUF222 domain-containing protein [Myxococcales bacterium]